jgi:hypothetical protein
MTILSAGRTSEKMFMSRRRICISISAFRTGTGALQSLAELRFDVNFSMHNNVTGHGDYWSVVELG